MSDVDEAIRRAAEALACHCGPSCSWSAPKIEAKLRPHIAPVIAAKDAEIATAWTERNELLAHYQRATADRDEWKRRAEAAEAALNKLADCFYSPRPRVKSVEFSAGLLNSMSTLLAAALRIKDELPRGYAAREKGGLATPYTEGEIPGGIKGAILHATREKGGAE